MHQCTYIRTKYKHNEDTTQLLSLSLTHTNVQTIPTQERNRKLRPRMITCLVTWAWLTTQLLTNAVHVTNSELPRYIYAVMEYTPRGALSYTVITYIYIHHTPQTVIEPLTLSALCSSSSPRFAIHVTTLVFTSGGRYNNSFWKQ